VAVLPAVTSTVPQRPPAVLRDRAVLADAPVEREVHDRTELQSPSDGRRIACSSQYAPAEALTRSIVRPSDSQRAGMMGPVREVWVNEVEDSVTGLIQAWSSGDPVAGDRLFARVYGELRNIARRLHRSSLHDGDATLDTTALVHEVYLRLAGATALNVQNRGHFFALVVRASRQVIINYARDARALKRGGDTVVESLEAIDRAGSVPQLDDVAFLDQVVALDDALTALENLHPRPCRVVECRYFGGLSITDTALALDISEATVKRDWAVAQAWLHRALRAAGVDHA
jgi:RNA polymerase sigma factor (TIGR02999 family)